MRVRSGTSQKDIDIFCKRASRVTLSQIVDTVSVLEELKSQGEARRTQYTIDISFFPKDEYQAEYDVEPLEILGTFATKFPLILKKEMQVEMKKLDANLKSQIAELGQGRKSRSGGADAGEDEEGDGEVPSKKKGDDEGSEVGDGDADDEKRARQKKQQATYDSDEENDAEDEEAYDDAAIEAAFASDAEEEEETVKKKSRSSGFKAEVNTVSDLFTRNLRYATSFTFAENGCTFQLEVSPALYVSIWRSLTAHFLLVHARHAKIALCWYH